MEYIEVKIAGLSRDNAEILIAEMCDHGFESFTDESLGIFSAYISADSYQRTQVSEFLKLKAVNLGFTYDVETIPDQNWNSVWESAYQPVRIGRCYIRAPFHQADPDAELDLIIEPKMSFGTAHHETTRLMIGTLLQIRFDGISVLDMGTGTGVLGILASKLGALKVVAIDNDEWSYHNAIENASRNNINGMLVIHGDAADIPMEKYGYIFANISRNMLLQDIPVYHSFLEKGGSLISSGLYEDDLPLISKTAETLGLKKVHLDTLNHWAVVIFKKC